MVFMVQLAFIAQPAERVVRNSVHCKFSNVVAFGHNKLWRLVAANSLFVTLKMLWTSATTIYGVRWLQMANLATLPGAQKTDRVLESYRGYLSNLYFTQVNRNLFRDRQDI